MTEANLARRLARYVGDFDARRLPPEVVACVRQRFLDSLACALGAYHAPPVQVARQLARAVEVPRSTVLGSTLQTTPELAAFANGTMVRYLDYNDGYMGLEPGHPSDSIFPCLALAEAEGLPGGKLVAAIVIAYEIQMRLQDAASLNKRGWDQVNYISVAMALAASYLFGLNESQAEQAINLSLNGHIAMRQVRSGTLSDWKGCSAANAARNAIFAAQLARCGMTGPAPIFEGQMGFFAQVTGALELATDRFGGEAPRDYAILSSLTKTFPTNGELHTAVWAALALRQRISDLNEISEILVETSEFNCRVLADAGKWMPSTRETADHSLPYNVARALLDGDISVDSYSPANISDPRGHALMALTKVAEDPALTALFPGRLANRVTVTLKSGEQLTEEVLSGPGSLEQPMKDRDFEQKFLRMAKPLLAADAQARALDFVARLEQQDSYSELFAALVPVD